MPIVWDESEERARRDEWGIGRLFRLVQDGVVVANARSETIVLWNEAASSLFGYSEDEALELPLHALVPERLRDRHRAGLKRFQDTGTGPLVREGRPIELPALKKDGTETPVELTLTAIPKGDAEGDRYAMAIVRDLSDRKAAERARLESIERDRRQQHALDLNDTVVQGLATAKLALDLGKLELAGQAVEKTLARAKRLVSSLLGDAEGHIDTGGLTRDTAAEVTGEQPEEGSD